MLFNSLEFFVFLPIVYFAYWFLNKRSLKLQNLLLLIASYVFYGWWDYRFLSLILFSTVVDYFVGLRIANAPNQKTQRNYLWVSIICNLGLLGFFKYYNFFVDSFVETFSFFGHHISNVWTLKIILPVGISFYTFQTLSYSLDIYRGKLKAAKDFVSFAAFVSFFPQLVAGPIERASNLMPQISSKRKFNYEQASDGLKLMLWGLVKKVVIADSLAPIVDDIFTNAADYPSSTLVLGAIFFGFQIYGDFSGYSDIAIGTSKLFGIELMSNFKFPYFSRNVAEFWRRWHISLSTWFRDYLYIPLGGSQRGMKTTIRNVFIIFVVSGFWHGANWTFIVWGGLHAMLFVPVLLMGKNRKYVDKPIASESFFPRLNEFFKILLTFILITITWIFFRAQTISEALSYIVHLFSDFTYSPYMHPMGYRMVDYFILLIIFIFYEYLIKNDERTPFPFKNRIVRFLIYMVMIFGLLMFYDSGLDRSFIYFQF
ncbi:MBOAT family O-acyltransferase [Flagellimonas lutimaris]|uniref:MBOAT family O-acyltransferase n=1 Tax=Flagellimonas lutimaris TaxID=475082 RepID=UPI0039C0B1D7